MSAWEMHCSYRKEKKYQQEIEFQNKRDVQVPWDSINVVIAALDFPGGML